VPHGQAIADGSAVVKDIHGKLRQSDSLCKLIDDASLYRFWLSSYLFVLSHDE
jgi:hypothetical protein